MNKLAEFMEREAGHVLILGTCALICHLLGAEASAQAFTAALLYAMKAPKTTP